MTEGFHFQIEIETTKTTDINLVAQRFICFLPINVGTLLVADKLELSLSIQLTRYTVSSVHELRAVPLLVFFHFLSVFSLPGDIPFALKCSLVAT